jgi:murein endopeptidase
MAQAQLLTRLELMTYESTSDHNPMVQMSQNAVASCASGNELDVPAAAGGGATGPWQTVSSPVRCSLVNSLLPVLAGLLLSTLVFNAFGSAFCDETPTQHVSMSYGSPARGYVEGAKRFVDSNYARVMPKRHRARCLSWGTERLVIAIAEAGAVVAKTHADSPPLGVGNIGRARGGSIRMFSRSHHAGRDADLAFYVVDRTGKPTAATDLVKIDSSLRGLDVSRTWTLVQALTENPSIGIRWLFVSQPIKRALLVEGRRQGASSLTLEKAERVLHQPSDAPAHDDHLHLRLRCTAEEARKGCSDG